LVLEEGMNVKIVVFPDNDDPDSYVRKVGTVAFQEFIQKNSQDFITFKARLYVDEIRNDPYRKSAVIKEMVATNTKIPDPIQRAVFRRQIAQLLDVDEQTLVTEENFLLRKQRTEERKKADNAPPEPPPLAYDLPDGVTLPQTDTPPAETQVVEPVRSAVSYREEGVVRLLLHYADRTLEGTADTVCDFVLRELEDIAFRTPVYQRIMDDFRAAWLQGAVLGSGDFMRHTDDDIRQTSIDLLAERHSVSSNWFDKFDIYVPHESENLLEETYNQVLRLKQEVVREKLAENQRELTATQDFEAQMNLLRERKQYKEIEKQIAGLLGNVVR
jgi:DNA primase